MSEIHEVKAKVDAIDSRLTSFEVKIDGYLDRLTLAVEKLTVLGMKQDSQEKRQIESEQELDSLKERFHTIDKSVDIANAVSGTVKEDVKTIKSDLKVFYQKMFWTLASFIIAVAVSGIAFYIRK